MNFIDPNMPPEQRKAQLQKVVETLQSLLQHPGFDWLDQYYKEEEGRAFNALQTSTTGDIAMKSAGAYVAIKSIRQLPKNYLLNAMKELEAYK